MVRTRRRPLLGSLVVAGAATLLAAQTAFAAVDWGPTREVSPAYSSNFGSSLARSKKDSTSYLHGAYTSVRIGGDFVDDNGPYAGVYYRRGNSSGSDWGTAKRLNPNSSHADFGALTASGRVVYAAYVTLGHWISYDPSEDRIITLRINSNHGGSSAWLSKKLTFGTRVDRPALAPWATRGVVLTYTDANSGDVIVVTCGDLTLEASGCAAGVVGTTTRVDPFDAAEGFEGLPVVSTSGDRIAVAWLTDGGASYATRTSGGAWSAPAALTATEAEGLSADARNGRFAFAWATGTGIKLRMWTSGGGLAATRTVATVSGTGTYKAAYSTDVALAGTSTAGVAWAACRRADCLGGASTGVDLRWRQSGDNGASWGGASTVASYSASSSRRVNDFPSAVMSSTTKRYVMFNALNANLTTFRVLLRVGSG